MVNGYHVSWRRHRSTERNSSFSHLVSTEFSELGRNNVDVEQDFVEMGDTELPDDDPVQCGANFVLFVTNWLRNSGNEGCVYTCDRPTDIKCREPDV